MCGIIGNIDDTKINIVKSMLNSQVDRGADGHRILKTKSAHYPVCLPKSIYYQDKIVDKNNAFKVAEHFSSNTISLPCGPHINENNSLFIAKIFKTCLKELIL